MFRVTVVMRDLLFFSVIVGLDKLTITDLCESFILLPLCLICIVVLQQDVAFLFRYG